MLVQVMETQDVLALVQDVQHVLAQDVQHVLVQDVQDVLVQDVHVDAQVENIEVEVLSELMDVMAELELGAAAMVTVLLMVLMPVQMRILQLMVLKGLVLSRVVVGLPPAVVMVLPRMEVVVLLPPPVVVILRPQVVLLLLPLLVPLLVLLLGPVSERRV